MPTTSPTFLPTIVPTRSPTLEPTAEPTAAPTTSPTFSPTENPTFEPSRSPTLSPTRAPTKVPTVPPSLMPTVKPTTRSPTLTGAGPPTRIPTMTPSFAPTYNYPILSSNMLRTIQSSIGVDDSAEIVNRLNYFEADVNTGSSATCSSWTSWISSSLSAASYQYKPATISWYRAGDVTKDDYSNAMCSSASETKTIVSTLMSVYSSSEKFDTIETVCDGRRWLIASCLASDEASSPKTYVPYLCVDCGNPCPEAINSYVRRVSSCSPFLLTRSFGVSALSVAYKELTVAPKIISVTAQPFETEIIVDVTLDVDGIVYVGLYKKSDDAPTSVDQVILQNLLSSTKGNTTQIILSNLQAASDYKVYVAAKSTLGAQSSVSELLATETVVSTTCCRKIIVSLASQTISEGTDIANFMSLSVPPSSEYSILLAFQVVATSTSTKSTPFVPSSVSIETSLSSASLSFKSALSKLTAGTYMVLVVLPNTVSADYEVLFNVGGMLLSSATGISLTVLSLESPLPAPSLSQAIFSSGGSYVAIKFNGNTNRANLGSTSFTCSQLLDFTCSESAKCQWNDAATIYAYVPNKDECAGVASKVTLVSSAEIRAQCPSATGCTTQSSWPVSDVSTTLLIEAPTSPISPTISMSAPSVMGNCSAFTLDVSSSTGNGGRSWQNMSVVVLSFDNNGNLVDSSSLQKYLTDNFVVSPPTSIAAKYFIAGQSYNFVVQLCNFFGKCSQASKRVTVLSTVVPTVSIPGSSLRTIKRSQALSISSTGSVKQCDSSASYIPLQYSWSIYKGTVADVTLSSTSKDPSKLLLAAYSLQKSTMYKMEVTVTALSQSATTNMQVYVIPGDIIASLVGGTTDRNLRPSETLQLDASKSYDEDIENTYGSSAGLKFAWSCVQLQPSLSSDCSSIFDKTTFDKYKSSEVVQLKALSTAANTLGQVSLTVTDSTASRTSTVTFEVEVLSALSPTLGLISNVATNSKMNSGKSLQLIATVSVPATVEGSLTWSADGLSSEQLSSQALTAVTQTLSKSSVAQSITMYLVLPSNALSAGSTYSFTMSCTLESPGISASSSISVSVNGAPSPGTFVVTPRSQPELQDPFLFACNNWQDTDLPLSYVFSYYSSSSKSQIVMRSKSELTYASISLPAGSSSNNYTVETTAEVFDFLSASATTTDDIQVFAQPEMSTSELTEYVGNSLSVLASSTDVDVIKQQSALTSYLLNKVNCTLAPDCAALNRGDCYRTAHTCGSCLSSDYIGDVGDSNNPCLTMDTLMSIISQYSGDDDSDDDSTARKRELTTSSIGDDTLSLLLKQKSCPSDCSSHGTCYYRFIDTKEIISECSALSFDCEAECDCDTGYEGTSNCALTDSEVSSRNTYRSQMISAVVVLTSLEENTDANVVSWINAMNDATVKSDEITKEGADDMLSFAKTTMNIVKSADISVSSMSNLLGTVGTVTEVIVKAKNAKRRRLERRQLSSDDSTTVDGTSIIEVLQTYGKVIASDMIPGQYPESLSSDYFKMLYGSYEVSSGSVSGGTCDSAVSMELSLSAMDQAYGYTPNAMTIPTCKTGMTSTSLSLTSVSSSLYDDSISGNFDSDPLSLHLSSFPCDADDADSCVVTIVLQRSWSSSSGRRKLTSSTGVEAVTFTCREGIVEVLTHDCENGLVVTTNCDGSKNYYVKTWCPVQYDMPNCNLMVGSIASQNPSCQLISYTDTNVTCMCSLLPQGYGVSARRLTVNNSTVPPGEYTINYVSMLVSMTDTFEQTLLSAGDLNADTLKKGWQAFVVVGVFAFFMSCWIGLAYYLDKVAASELEILKKKEAQRKEMASGIGKVHQGVTSGVATSGAVMEEETETVDNNFVFSSKNFLSFAEKALPQIMSSSSFLYRVKGELKRHHRWAGVLFHFSKKFPRALRVVSLATNIIVMLFIQSITYALTKGDDGSCGEYNSESACLDPRSPYSTGGPKCYWVSDAKDKDGGDCHFIQADSDVKVVIFVAVFSAMLSTPLALSADWLIKNILAAPVLSNATLKKLQKLKTGKAESAMTGVVPSPDRAPRQASNNLSSLHSIDIATLHATAKSNRAFTALNKAVKLYFNSITDNSVKRDFAASWGLDDYGDFLHDEHQIVPSSTEEPIEPGLVATCLKAILCVPKSGTELIRSELFEVERNLAIEKLRFEQELTSEKSKNMRLLYLFQKDLMPGITGQILESQGIREDKFVKGVSRTAQFGAWMALFLLNGGMLFYILLFAVSQEPHRQSAWAKSFATWLVIEIVIVSSLVVLLMNVLVPSVIMRDVGKIKKRLLASLQQYHEKMQSQENKTALVSVLARSGGHSDGESEISGDEESIKRAEDFNASRFLFVSFKMAKRFPELKVAKIIREFSTPWPKQSYLRTSDVSNNYGGKFKTISTAAGTIAMFFITTLLSIPLTFQDLIIQMSTTVLAGGIALLHVDLFRVHPALIVIPALVVVVAGGLIYLVLVYGLAKKTVSPDDSSDVAAAIDALAAANEKKGEQVVPVVESVPKNFVNQRQSIIQGVDIARKAQTAAVSRDIESGGNGSDAASSSHPKHQSSEGNEGSSVGDMSFKSLDVFEELRDDYQGDDEIVEDYILSEDSHED